LDEKDLDSFLRVALKSSGSVVIREFTSTNIEYIIPEGDRKGEKNLAPIKNIYGIFISNGLWSHIPGKEMEVSFCTYDYTVILTPSEDDICFPDFHYQRLGGNTLSRLKRIV